MKDLKVQWKDALKTTVSPKKSAKDADITYRTKTKDDGSCRLQIRIYKKVMGRVDWKAGDRVKLVRAAGFDNIIGIKKDPAGYKLCPQPEKDEAYSDAIGKVRTVNFSAQLTESDTMPLTVGITILAHSLRYSPESEVLSFSLPTEKLELKTKNFFDNE